MPIADRVALLFFAAVFSVAVGASIDGGLRSLTAATASHCLCRMLDQRCVAAHCMHMCVLRVLTAWLATVLRVLTAWPALR